VPYIALELTHKDKLLDLRFSLSTREYFCLVPYNAVWSIESQLLLATCLMLVPFLTYSSTLKVEVTCFSETSVELQRKTQSYIPENGIRYNRQHENLEPTHQQEQYLL
jgi:hypothetical protein